MRTLIKVATLAYFFSHSCLAEEEKDRARTNLDDAIRQIIIKEDSNRVLGAETEIIDGKEIYVVKVLTPHGHIQHYKIDPETGELLN
jgi:uncharacterized membrane protein YkoI